MRGMEPSRRLYRAARARRYPRWRWLQHQRGVRLVEWLRNAPSRKLAGMEPRGRLLFGMGHEWVIRIPARVTK